MTPSRRSPGSPSRCRLWPCRARTMRPLRTRYSIGWPGCCNTRALFVLSKHAGTMRKGASTDSTRPCFRAYVLIMFTGPAIPEKPARSAAPSAAITRLREHIARIERIHTRGTAAKFLPFGIPAIDQALPGGGINLAALHEAASVGPDTEHAAAATLFVAGLLARLDGPVLWVLRQADLFAPGLAAAGLRPDRVVFAEAGKPMLPVMEEGLR